MDNISIKLIIGTPYLSDSGHRVPGPHRADVAVTRRVKYIIFLGNFGFIRHQRPLITSLIMKFKNRERPPNYRPPNYVP